MRPFRASARDAALAGAVSAAVAIGVTELASGLTSGIPSLVRAVGALVIDAAPARVVHAAIEVLGTKDKPVLVAGIVVTALLAGALLGLASRRNVVPAALGLGGFGLAGSLAAARVPEASMPLVVLTVLAAAGAGLTVFVRLRRAAPALSTAASGSDLDRRVFLRGATAAAIGAMAAGTAGFGGRYIRDRLTVAASRADLVLPDPARVAPPAPPGPDVRGLSRLVTPNADFYRIDTALTPPAVDPGTWRLSVTGRVSNPYTIGLDELLELPSVEEYATLACVSNEVGGSLVSNALWQGVPLRDVIERARPQDAGSQIVGRSVDGFTAGFPTEAAFDGRVALLAYAMNGEPLPVRHGFPARLVVAGLYGYVSATKWLSEIMLTGWDDFDAYWIPRGWAKEAPIKTQSRIDVPRAGSALSPGEVAVAGVAWAPTRGIHRVEVKVDDGSWRDAELGPELSDNTWRQWVLRWDADPGDHSIDVRATDGAGETQDERRRPPAPDGATGYHRIWVTVRRA